MVLRIAACAHLQHFVLPRGNAAIKYSVGVMWNLAGQAFRFETVKNSLRW